MSITNGLVAHFKFDDNVNDSFGSNNGTPLNITYEAGKFNNGAKFNGSDSEVSVNSTIRALFQNKQAYTIACYFKPLNFNTTQTLFCSNVSNAYNGYGRSTTLHCQETTGKLVVFRADGTSQYSIKFSTGSLILNSINTCIIKYDGTNLAVSLNGSNFETLASSFNTPAQGVGYIGIWKETGSSFHKNSGVIDEMSFYNVAFTDQDAADYHNTGVQYPYTNSNITNSKFMSLLA